MSIITIKRGATLQETISFSTAGAPTVLTGLTMVAMVRDAEDNLVATLTPTVTGTVGQAQILVEDTSAWPEGLLRMDVEVTQPGGPQIISDTFGIEVLHAETYTLPPAAPFDPVDQP